MKLWWMLLTVLLISDLLICMQKNKIKKAVRFVDEQVSDSLCLTVVPFSNPFDEDCYEQFIKSNCPEQHFTKRSSLYFRDRDDSSENERISTCTTTPFKSIAMEPFDRLQFHHEEFGYSFLISGLFLYNQFVDTLHQKTLPEQYYTRKSTLWCVKR